MFEFFEFCTYYPWVFGFDMFVFFWGGVDFLIWVVLYDTVPGFFPFLMLWGLWWGGLV